MLLEGLGVSTKVLFIIKLKSFFKCIFVQRETVTYMYDSGKNIKIDMITRYTVLLALHERVDIGPSLLQEVHVSDPRAGTSQAILS